MPELLAGLSQALRAGVLAAVAAVECADAPVSGDDFAALRDPALRRAVEDVLAASGRTLVEHAGGWLSGYRDDIADRLVTEGLGVLSPTDRAVLALVLLHTVAIPRARGRVTSENWSDALPTTVEELERNRHLTQKDIRASLRRLRTAGILRPGRSTITPGPQFLRLTAERSSRLSEDLVLLCHPDGMLAHVIRRRRADRMTRQETASV